MKVKIDILEKENASRKNNAANILEYVKKMFEASIKSTTETVITRLSNEQNLLLNQTINHINIYKCKYS